MSWVDNLFALIGTRSFSSVWYWLMLAAAWTIVSQRVIGVPFDMVIRARRHGGAASDDLEEMVRINVARRLHDGGLAGPGLVALAAAGLTMLMLLGFVYGLEFAQALFLLVAPLCGVSLMGASTARRIRAEALGHEALCRLLTRHRMWIHLLGAVAILVTTLWGMWHNLGISVLRG